MPESVRWLIANKRPDEARAIILKAARMNGVTIPNDVIDRELVRYNFHVYFTCQVEPPQLAKATLLDLFSHWRLAKNTCIIFFAWWEKI